MYYSGGQYTITFRKEWGAPGRRMSRGGVSFERCEGRIKSDEMAFFSVERSILSGIQTDVDALDELCLGGAPVLLVLWR